MSEIDDRKEILDKVKEYYRNYLDDSKNEYTEGDRIAYASRVFDENEVLTVRLISGSRQGAMQSSLKKECVSFLM